jgi:acyl-coenzyme A synthetase/AMP-(fatty) acid ligase
MAPSRIVFIKNIPLNGNAKIDRLQLQNILEQEKEGVIHE